MLLWWRWISSSLLSSMKRWIRLLWGWGGGEDGGGGGRCGSGDVRGVRGDSDPVGVGDGDCVVDVGEVDGSVEGGVVCHVEKLWAERWVGVCFGGSVPCGVWSKKSKKGTRGTSSCKSLCLLEGLVVKFLSEIILVT